MVHKSSAAQPKASARDPLLQPFQIKWLTPKNRPP